MAATTSEPSKRGPRAAAAWGRLYAPPGTPRTGYSKRGPRGAAAWVASTYFAEGLPYSIVHQIAAEMFTALGASLQAVGYTALYGLAWNAKGAWSPLVEKHSTTRRWIIGVEIALAVVVAAVAWPAQLGDLASIARLLVVVSFLAATHDIAIDGFYLRALEPSSQTSFVGLRIGAYRAALLAGKGLLVILAGLTSWRVCFLAAAGILLALAALHTALLPREERRSEATGLRFEGAFRTFLAQPHVIPTLGFIIFYRAGDALMFAMSTPLLKDLGLQTAARGVLNTIGSVVSIGGSMVGSAVISRFGFARTIRPIALVQSGAILLYVVLAWTRPSAPGIVVLVTVEQFVAGAGTTALMVFLMRRSASAYKTSHFAIGTSLMSLATTLLGSVSGHLAARLGFVLFFALAFAASLPGVVFSYLVPTDDPEKDLQKDPRS